MYRPLKSVLYAGLVAGTIDLVAAAAINSVGFSTVLHAVASGVLGKAAYDGDSYVEILGLVLQWAMSMAIAAIFVLAAMRLPVLLRRWIVAGLAYGVIVFFVMNYVVLPLSAVGHMAHFKPASFVLNLLAMLLFGAIVASIARRFLAGAWSRPRR